GREAMSEVAGGYAYVLAAVCFIVALKALSSPRRARVGNLVGAVGAAIAVLVVFAVERPANLLPILGAILVGGAVGILAARRVAMTAMPQMVAIFNGLGGAAGAIVALLEIAAASAGTNRGELAVAGFTILIGSVTFSGSMIAFAPLQEPRAGGRLVFPGMRWLCGASRAAAVAAGVWLPCGAPCWVALGLAAVRLSLGVVLVLPVGGADVPGVTALLNGFSGISVAAGGYVL